MRLWRMDWCVCSRSHGQPPGPRRRAMILRSRATFLVWVAMPSALEYVGTEGMAKKIRVVRTLKKPCNRSHTSDAKTQRARQRITLLAGFDVNPGTLTRATGYRSERREPSLLLR